MLAPAFGVTSLSLVAVFYIERSSASRLMIVGSDLLQIRTRGRLTDAKGAGVNNVAVYEKQ